MQFAGQAGLAGAEQRADDRAGIGRIGLAEAAGRSVADSAQAQIAGGACFGVLGQQLQGQVQRGRGRVQGVRIGEGQQPAIFTRLLDEADT